MRPTTASWTYLLLLLFCCVRRPVVVVVASLPKAAPADTPWDDLRAQLSDASLLQAVTVQEFADKCLQPFVVSANPFASSADGATPVVSNYQLLDYPVCLDHAYCAYEDCAFDQNFPIFPDETSPFVLFKNPLTRLFDKDVAVDEERLSLPAMTLEPQGAADIIHALEFCTEHQIGVSVKVSSTSTVVVL